MDTGQHDAQHAMAAAAAVIHLCLCALPALAAFLESLPSFFYTIYLEKKKKKDLCRKASEREPMQVFCVSECMAHELLQALS